MGASSAEGARQNTRPNRACARARPRQRRCLAPPGGVGARRHRLSVDAAAAAAPPPRPASARLRRAARARALAGAGARARSGAPRRLRRGCAPAGVLPGGATTRRRRSSEGRRGRRWPPAKQSRSWRGRAQRRRRRARIPSPRQLRALDRAQRGQIRPAASRALSPQLLQTHGSWAARGRAACAAQVLCPRVGGGLRRRIARTRARYAPLLARTTTHAARLRSFAPAALACFAGRPLAR